MLEEKIIQNIMNKRILIFSLVLVLFALYMKMFSFQETVPLKRQLDEFPLHWKGWEGNIFNFDEKTLSVLRVSEYLSRNYMKGSDRINLYIGYYGSQREGIQIHSPKHCLPGSGWFKLSERDRSLDIERVGKITFVEALYQKGTEKELFIYWYEMKNAYITDDYMLKWYMILNSLKYRRNEAAFIRFSTPVKTSIEESSYLIENAMRDFLPLLKDYMPD